MPDRRRPEGDDSWRGPVSSQMDTESRDVLTCVLHFHARGESRLQKTDESACPLTGLVARL